MPVDEPDLEAAADRYAAELPGRLDLVHLGLGADGHTASLVPGDPVLDVRDRLVAVTGEYEGYRRMTLTYPALETRARDRLARHGRARSVTRCLGCSREIGLACRPSGERSAAVVSGPGAADPSLAGAVQPLRRQAGVSTPRAATLVTRACPRGRAQHLDAEREVVHRDALVRRVHELRRLLARPSP